MVTVLVRPRSLTRRVITGLSAPAMTTRTGGPPWPAIFAMAWKNGAGSAEYEYIVPV